MWECQEHQSLGLTWSNSWPLLESQFPLLKSRDTKRGLWTLLDLDSNASSATARLCDLRQFLYLSVLVCLIRARKGHSQRGAQAEAGQWNLECQVQGLRPFSQNLGSHTALMGTSGTGCRKLVSGPCFLPYSPVEPQGWC